MTTRISQILTPERTQQGAQCTSKKRLMEHISTFLAEHINEADSDEIYERLIAREKLGSTGIGEGIAIPHSRLGECEGTIGALFTLKDPIDFDAIDRQPVDIIFVLLVPEEATDEHLQTLSMLAQKLNLEHYRDKLRAAQTHSELYEFAISE